MDIGEMDCDLGLGFWDGDSNVEAQGASNIYLMIVWVSYLRL
jgi:hypothetical protein